MINIIKYLKIVYKENNCECPKNLLGKYEKYSININPIINKIYQHTIFIKKDAFTLLNLKLMEVFNYFYIQDYLVTDRK